jgi:hypothetical protein
VLNLTIIRRTNVQQLFQTFAELELAQGTAPKGLEQRFAARLQISPSMWSQIKAERPIGDKLARQIETHSAKAAGWLDQRHATEALDEDEKAFLQLALQAFRKSSRKARRELSTQLTHVVESASD